MSGPSPSIIARTRGLLRQALAMGQTRLEMLGLEVEKERLALGREIRLAAICVVGAWLAGTTLVLWVVVALPQTARVWLLGGLFLAFALAAALAWLALRRSAHRERLFSRLAKQLRLDRISLGEDP